MIPKLVSNPPLWVTDQCTAEYSTMADCLICSAPFFEITYLCVFTYQSPFTWLSDFSAQLSVAGLNPSNCSVSVCSVFAVCWCHQIPSLSTKEFTLGRESLAGEKKKNTKNNTTGKACPDLKTTSCRDVDSYSRAVALPGSLQQSSHSVVTSEEEWTGNSFHQMHFNCRPTGCHSQILESKRFWRVKQRKKLFKKNDRHVHN